MTRTWQIGTRQWRIPHRGAIMGILNVTPDSFSDGGQHNTPEAALEHARRMVAEGAHIIDVGGESTRPGSQEVGTAEETKRTIPVIRAIRAEFPDILISIDTRHAQVARAALEAGADILNDITGLRAPGMLELCAEQRNRCGIILMHMQGEPCTMQLAPRYENVVEEVARFFRDQVHAAMAAGIAKERICLDPGIGFGKTTEHNVQLIHHLAELRVYNLPMLMALSRKRFLGDVYGDRMNPASTVKASLLSAKNGADLHRVHDVAALHRALYA